MFIQYLLMFCRSAEVQKFKRQQEAGAQEIQKLKAERLHAMMNAQAEKKNVTCHQENFLNAANVRHELIDGIRGKRADVTKKSILSYWVQCKDRNEDFQIPKGGHCKNLINASKI